jgi:hypothetical protein
MPFLSVSAQEVVLEKVKITPMYFISKPITVAFHDQRPEILAGIYPEACLGRYNYSINASLITVKRLVCTKSEQPLCTEFNNSLDTSFSKRNVNVVSVEVSPYWAVDRVLDSLKSKGRDRIIYFRIFKWQTEYAFCKNTNGVKLIYDLQAEVFDSSGNQLVFRKYIDSVCDWDKSRSFDDNFQYANESLFQNLMNRFFNDPQVESVLQIRSR